MSYIESMDLFNKNVINLFDYETGVCIGYVTEIEGSFIATPVGINKPSSKFQFLPCAKGYISSCFYCKKVNKSKSKEKQLNLML